MDFDHARDTARDGADGFDFLIGRWQVAHRRLRSRLSGCETWDAFVGTCEVRNVLGGAGNVDDNQIDLPQGAYRAVTLRTWDPASQRWTIWWLDGRTPGRLDTPMVGGFENETGLFFADDTFEGRAIRVRFRWTLPQPGAPRWEQAFSADGGERWETNWVMDFTAV